MAAPVYNVIQSVGSDNREIIYKTQITDFKNDSVLIVEPSQQAIIYKDGAAEGPFLEGKHVLPTNNISKFRAFFKKLFSRNKEEPAGVPFTCDVFFINTANDVAVSWGTPNRIMVKDPLYNELVNVGSNGTVNIGVADAVQFVTNMVGRMGDYSIDRIAATVRSDILTVLKTNLAGAIVENNVSLLEINTKLEELGDLVASKLNAKLADYGLSVRHFNIVEVSVDEASQGRLLARQNKINARSDIVLDSDAMTTAEYNRTVRMAEAHAKEREVQGYTYQDEQYWKTQQNMAAGGGYMHGGYPYPNMGYPGAVPPVPPVNPYYGQPMYGGAASFCPNCRAPMPYGAAFCQTCGYRAQPMQPVQPQQNQQSYGFSPAAQSGVCPKCGYPVTPRTEKCPSCNLDLTKGN